LRRDPYRCSMAMCGERRPSGGQRRLKVGPRLGKGSTEGVRQFETKGKGIDTLEHRSHQRPIEAAVVLQLQCLATKECKGQAQSEMQRRGSSPANRTMVVRLCFGGDIGEKWIE
jgi:hypothetical protein